MYKVVNPSNSQLMKVLVAASLLVLQVVVLEYEKYDKIRKVARIERFHEKL